VLREELLPRLERAHLAFIGKHERSKSVNISIGHFNKHLRCNRVFREEQT
jgi:hypothetical protein